MGANVGLSFEGTFSGATGRYGCTGTDCSLTLDDDGAATAMVGTWTLAVDIDATLSIPDCNYLHFGWWLNAKDDDTYGFHAIAGGTGFASGSGNIAATMTGEANYTGAAAGVYVTLDIDRGEVTDADEGEFTASVNLRAHFFGDSDSGEMQGAIEPFKDEAGRALPGWRVTLDTARLDHGSASFAG